MKKLTLALAMAGLMTASASISHALTGKEVIDEIGREGAAGYFTGALDMYAFLHTDRAQCAFKWFDAKGLNIAHAAMDKYPDKPAAAMLYVLIKRECGPK